MVFRWMELFAATGDDALADVAAENAMNKANNRTAKVRTAIAWTHDHRAMKFAMS